LFGIKKYFYDALVPQSPRTLYSWVIYTRYTAFLSFCLNSL
jgi:hypothetical protein